MVFIDVRILPVLLVPLFPLPNVTAATADVPMQLDTLMLEFTLTTLAFAVATPFVDELLFKLLELAAVGGPFMITTFGVIIVF